MHNTCAYYMLHESQRHFHLAAIFVLSSLMYSVTERHNARNYILHACMCAYICMHIHTFTVLPISIHLSTHTCRFMYVCYIHAYIQVKTHSCMPTYIYGHTYIYPCEHKYIIMHVKLHTYLDTNTYIDSHMFAYIQMDSYLHTYVHANIHISCMHTNLHL